MRFPPVMSRAQLERSGYLKSFPNLLGCVLRAFMVLKRKCSTQWRASTLAANGPLRCRPPISSCITAACYPVYPFRGEPRVPCPRAPDVRRRGRLLPPRALEVARSASVLPHARVRLHRLAADVADFRERWMVRAQQIARDLGLAFRSTRRPIRSSAVSARIKPSARCSKR